jgi:hypothetical protein
MKAIAKTHQFMTFTTPPNLQWGAATGCLTTIISRLAADMQRKRDRLGNALVDIGRGAAGDGTTRDHRFPAAGLQRHRRGFCRHITVEAALPRCRSARFMTTRGGAAPFLRDFASG